MEDYTSPDTAVPLRLKVVAAVLGVGLLGFGGYAVHEHNVAQKAEQQNSQVSASLQTTNSQIAQLTSKINDLEAAKVAQPVEAPAPAPALKVGKSKAAAGHAVRRDDPRWKKMQDQLDAQQQALNSTNQNLDTAKTELGGSIAKTHDELVVLQKKGERNYYEFDIAKEKTFHPNGPIGIRLRKANVKHQYADLELLVDDRSLTQKHVNLMQPAIFYASDSEVPVEIVINSVSKDHIHGYVSAPKYRRSELASSQTQPTTATPVDATPNGAPALKSRAGTPK